MLDLGEIYGIYIYSRTICMIWETYMEYIYIYIYSRIICMIWETYMELYMYIYIYVHIHKNSTPKQNN